MGINFGQIKNMVKLINGIKNPKQGLSMAADMLSQKNPQLGNLIKNAISSGKDPKAFITESDKNGQITLNQLDDLKQLYTLASSMGLSMKVPDTVWKDAENSIRLGSNNTSNVISANQGSATGMSGF